MAAKTKKFAMTFAIIVAMVLRGSLPRATTRSGSVIRSAGFDDRIVVTRPFFPFFPR
jgi:hypothetical protein